MNELENLGNLNKAFEHDKCNSSNQEAERDDNLRDEGTNTPQQQSNARPSEPERQKWANPLEFLMSCIAMSVGLGNIWRFPFTAFENGGGAFLIPYIIVLFLIGKPLYYMEMAVGQFSAGGSVKIWEMCPALRGIGYGQMYGTFLLLSYYCSLMALTLYYLFASFSSQLPWSKCDTTWEKCLDSERINVSQAANLTGYQSSSELFFLKTVLHEEDTIDYGIGIPDWKLTLCSGLAWIILYVILVKGIKGAGKVAYFLAIFPYVVLITLLVRALTLPGSVNGIMFFIEPKWEELLKPNVWYAAVTQSFFSLNTCMGSLIMYSSYNEFTHNVYRDSMIVTTMDTVTSFIAGCTIFGILGHLAFQLGTDDITAVVKDGTGLAFISYPDVIAKFDVAPQFFSIVFFIMMFTLGSGSAVSLISTITTIICDEYTSAKHYYVTLGICICGFLVGLVYLTPGGQFVLNLVDFYGVTMIIFSLASVEMAAIAWIYGVDNLCSDVEFMLQIKVGRYWRISWAIITPVLLIVILSYSIAKMENVTYKNYVYPETTYAFGWTIMSIGILQLPLWIIIHLFGIKKPMLQRVKTAFSPTEEWGPKKKELKEKWIAFKNEKRSRINSNENAMWKILRIFCNIKKHHQRRSYIC